MSHNKLNNMTIKLPLTYMDKRLSDDGQFLLFSIADDFFGQCERQGVKEWQEELFAPSKIYKSLEEEYKQHTGFCEEYFDEEKMLDWLCDAPKDEYSLLKNLLANENRRQILSPDPHQVMIQLDKNPLFTNMDVDEHVPQHPRQIKFEEVEKNKVFVMSAGNNGFQKRLK